MRKIILYRDDVDWRQEADAAKKYFECTNSRMTIQPEDLVIARFSALPFYKEQEYDINYVGAKMINTYQQHRYIADLANWADDLEGLTPKTWTRLQDLPEQGPFILKGETNSKKYYWKTHMYAADKRAACEVESRLHADSLITYQNIYIRQYIPLHTYLIGLQDLPITKEFRFFVYKDQILSGGYYWLSHTYELEEMGIKPDVNEVPSEFLNKVISRVKDKVNFYVIDVAQTQSGDWIVIELNDGQMSGLSENDPNELYKNLANAL